MSRKNKTQIPAEDYGRWGDVFETATKIGILHFLANEHLIDLEHFPTLTEWQDHDRNDVINSILTEWKVIDDNEKECIQTYCEHLFVVGFGLGFTVGRRWLATVKETCVPQTLRQKRNVKPEEVKNIWCPLTLPSRQHYDTELREEQRKSQLGKFWKAMDIDGVKDTDWNKRGWPANADFLLVLQDKLEDQHLLCIEFSLNVLSTLPDFSQEIVHLEELRRYVTLIEQRGVFSHIRSEVSKESFEVSEKIVRYIGSMTTQDKPLYKLCQGASYATQWVREMAARDQSVGPILAHVIAVTAAGIETIIAPLHNPQEISETEDRDNKNETVEDPRTILMETLGRIYREPVDYNPHEEGLSDKKKQSILNQICSSFPYLLRKQFKALQEQKTLDNLATQHPLRVHLHEEITDFVNPVQPYEREQALSWLQSKDTKKQEALDKFFGQPAIQAIASVLDVSQPASLISLRELHGAAIRAALKACPYGAITLLGLEGHPGIGKTYSTVKTLKELDEGFLFFYASPRILINNDVTNLFAITSDVEISDRNALALTTNFVINSGARKWYENHREEYGMDIKYVDGAVVCNMPPGFVRPSSACLFLNQEAATEIDEHYSTKGFDSRMIDETTNRINQSLTPGVMKTLAIACKEALESSPLLNRVVLTGAIQGYREHQVTSNTIDVLGTKLFNHTNPTTPNGIKERNNFAKRMPTIVVMIDEIAGDSAGPLIVRAFATMLRQQFIDPFLSRDGSPFRIVLIVADASLGNDVVLESFLSSGNQAPQKVLISKGRSSIHSSKSKAGDDSLKTTDSAEVHPFAMVAKKIKIDQKGNSTTLPSLHIMADAYPASSLQIDYALHLTPMAPVEQDEQFKKTSSMVMEQTGDEMLRIAALEILEALEKTPTDQQVIFFAQHKPFLRDLETLLLDKDELQKVVIDANKYSQLTRNDVAKIDGSIENKKRYDLMKPKERDSKRLILMTSSGSRGVNFPRSTTIIAQVPNFSIESGLMEITQLIFRGRGEGGDQLDRRLVMVLHDFVFPDLDGNIDINRWTRQLIDLITMVVLLRASILTRIKGDAGLSHQSLSIVPVGEIGTEPMLQTMAQSLGGFLHEAQVLIRDAQAKSTDKGLVSRADDGVQRLFENAKWRATFKKHKFKFSIVNQKRFHNFLQEITRPGSPMVQFDNPSALEDSFHCNGMLWCEDWSGAQLIEESFSFDLWKNHIRKAFIELYKRLIAIKEASSLPPRLKTNARDLIKFLHREEKRLQITQLSTKRIDKAGTWVIMPVDYPRFMSPIFNEDEDIEEIVKSHDLDAFWHKTLSRAAALNAMISVYHPVLPVYKKAPHFAFVSTRDPLGITQALDHRYFMATREFNLLSTLLFGD